MTANNGSPFLQLAELELFSFATVTTPAPSAPTGLSADAVSGDQIILTWSDNTRWEEAYRLEQSPNGSTGWSTVAMLPVGTTRFRHFRRTGSTTYYYRLRAENHTANSGYASASGTTPTSTPASTWVENYHFSGSGPNETLTHAVTDGNVSIYRDPETAGTNVTWVKDLTKAVWQHVGSTYGGLSGDRLHLALHEPALGPNFALTKAAHETHRHTVDLRGAGGTWANTALNRDVLSHEISHLVEAATYDLEGSPANAIWGDSMFAEIFQYDAYIATGYTDDADRWYREKMKSKVPFPNTDTYWFRDWFHPIYSEYGAAPLAGFFELLSLNFHQYNSEYARKLTWGGVRALLERRCRHGPVGVGERRLRPLRDARRAARPGQD